MFKRMILPAAALALLWVIGCSKSSNSITDTSTTDIAAKFGGYTTSNEAPGFGDPTLTAAAQGEQPIDDTCSGLPLIDSILSDPNAGVYHLRVVWGHLPADTSETDWTVWDGSLALSHGAEVVRRVIRFEDGDSLLPRTDKGLIEWVSRTRGGSEGIAVDLFVPHQVPTIDSSLIPSIDSVINVVIDTIDDTLIDTITDTLIDTTFTMTYDTIPATPVTLAFQTGPYSRTFTLPDLVSLDTVITLGDSNAVAFAAVRLDHFPCPRGFLAGTWAFDTTGVGTFTGLWFAKSGLIDGSYQGTLGYNDSGKQVFYGKWIDTQGKFEGLMRGYWGLWGRGDNTPHARRWVGGWFLGGVFDGEANQIGVMAGRIKSLVGDNQTGFMMGRWKIGCPDYDVDNNDDHMDDGPDGTYQDHPEDYGDSVKPKGNNGNGNGNGRGNGNG